MALKKTIVTAHGFEATDAYHRVECVEIQSKTSISYRVRSYKSETGFPFFDEKYLTSEYDINGENPISQAYAHVKALAEFADAVDC